MKGGNENIIEATIDIKNPLIIRNSSDSKALRNSFGGDEKYFDLNPSDIQSELQRRGYDGVIDKLYGQKIVFSPEQIKNKITTKGNLG